MTARASEQKTQPTDRDVQDFIATVDTSAVRRADAVTLVEIMRQETGQEPVLWGPSIIGFGRYHYTYASGHTGDAAAAGFSPRKTKLVLYGLTAAPGVEPLLARLGTFTSSVACLYLTKLADVDEEVLRELIRRGYAFALTLDTPARE